MAGLYLTGQKIRLTLNVNNATATGIGVDPTALTFRLTEPGTSADLTYTWPGSTSIATSSAGGFFIDYLAIYKGKHAGKWTGSGTNGGAAEFTFDVR